ncbi:glycosyltransferase [Flavobacterium sp. PL002]|uniref:glycosyltransferase family 2 protein n=1 Tax=Flavobacterium sp. PL002 TaxID=1897058 RepID=UPI00178807EC|nr:glycosyltransferase [Flavobacterium sp. PL002]MBE0390898.1 hypothetical protein [Flavobacterium sp. PL002]
MLSILIPIYNYNAFPLVHELHKQCVECNIDFEIICIDDASTLCTDANTVIDTLLHCKLIVLKKNIGRSQIRNQLAFKAQYQWFLFLDCDTFPKKDTFIKNYFQKITIGNHKVFSGGLAYAKNKPENNQLLRWVYGKSREEIPLKIRKKNPYQTALVSNVAIHKTIFETINFNENIKTYGYEDYFFVQELEMNHILVIPIENPVLHLNLETSVVFLQKTKTALETLFQISKKNNIAINTPLIKTYKKLESLRITALFSFLFRKNKTKLERQLLSKKPNLFMFDLYKIGYFCFLNHQ